MKRFVFSTLSTILLCIFALTSFAQEGTIISLKGLKPAEYANKILRAEKTDYGDLSSVKKFIQNTFVHYNYLFNANQIFNSTLHDAIAANTDDYSLLLSFYPYNEKQLANNKSLDSVIQHATQGLLLHDLRNDYVDELYFVLGKSYLFKNIYDTAQSIFKYINYAFAPKDEGYDVPVGSNISNKNNKKFSISNQESTGLMKKNNLKNINRRNDAMLWLARTYIKEKNYTEASLLLNNLNRDIYFPERLQPLLNETKAYLFYNQQMYDSAATYLSQCNFDDDTKQLKARRAYLTAQLYQLSGNDSLAIQYFSDAENYSNNPEIGIYSEKNILSLKSKINSSTNVEGALGKLLNKNKYYPYKDLIYYSQAQIAKQNNQDNKASDLLWQSIKANRNSISPNLVQKSRTYNLLANIDYDNNRFDSASKHYDSVQTSYINDSASLKKLNNRISALHEMAQNYDSIRVRDSLLALANMPENERMNILKKKAREIRRAIDKREENNNDNVSVNSFVKQNQPAVDLFSGASNGSVWYFDNQNAKSSGYQLFKQKFGNRPNVDNWQRLSAISVTPVSQPTQKTDSNLLSSLLHPESAIKEVDSASITPEDLLASLPMTTEKKLTATNIITKNLLANGEILQNQLENFTGAIYIFDSLVRTYPAAPEAPQALYDMYVCNMLLGKNTEAEMYKNKLLSQFPTSEETIKFKNIAKEKNKISPSSIANAATKEYSAIYDLFLAGKFDEAVKRKATADSIYGRFYWTPQLLYIEAIYHVSKNQDSVAINKLFYLINTFPDSKMIPQAKNMIDVLDRRKQIEAYLASLNVKPMDYEDADLLAQLERGAQRMNEEEKRIAMFIGDLVHFPIPKIKNEKQELDKNSNPIQSPFNVDTAKNVAVNPQQNITQNNLPTVDSSQLINKKINIDTVQNIPVANNHHPAIDSSQIKNINQNNIANNQQQPITDSSKIVKANPNNKVEEITNYGAPHTDTSNVNKIVIKNTPTKPETRNPLTINGFSFSETDPQYVVILLDSVAPVFASEATNAFNRYNLLTFPNQQYNVNSQVIDNYNIVLIGPFANMQDAKDYQAKIQPQAPIEIIPWITSNKYLFIKISPQNLNKIHTKVDVEKYRAAATQAKSE